MIGASCASDMRYTPSSSDISASCILQISSLHAAHMPQLFDPQMSGPSSSYMPQMTAPDPSWHHDSPFEWSNLFLTAPSLNPYEGVEEVTQLVDAPAASVILDMHAQETSIDIGEGPS